MSVERLHPTSEEIESTYRILAGMSFRKRFLSDQDREDFVQDVMLSAFRSYDAERQDSLSYKNLACGPAFHRAYQSYWRRFYRRVPVQPIPTGDGKVEVDELSDENSERPTDYLLLHELLEEIDSLEEPHNELMILFLQGMTREEVARIMKKSLSWAKKYTLKAQQLLIQRLKGRGIVVETLDPEQLLT
jgi:DNA-directed RNA polymerase specialized sigma24 family protein